MSEPARMLTELQINEAISSWFEPKPESLDFDKIKWWAVIFNGEGHRYYPLDYYHDEAANARLLEAMPNASLQHWEDGWRCTPMIQHFGGESQIGYHPDRKTAVVLAFCEFAGIEVEHVD